MTASTSKAIFLDRDGVINCERGDYTWLLEDFKLNDGVVEALIEFQSRGYLLIVITNQGGIAKGLYTKADTDYLHLHLQRTLSNRGIVLTEIYYCPHHTEVTQCLCRKPGSLLLEKALARFQLDASRCYFIGDAQRDADAARSAGIRSITVPSNDSLWKVVPLVE